MQILIDGYNLLFAAGFGFGDLKPGELHAARVTMLNYLDRRLSQQRLEVTTIVFDAKDAPRHLPAELSHGCLHVWFARDHAEADDLIEELIRRCSVPRKLLVVTDDLRLQQAAKRRRSQLTGCHDWLDELERSRHGSPAARGDERPQRQDTPQLSADEVDRWLNIFGAAPTVGEPPGPPLAPPSTNAEPRQTPADRKPPRGPAAGKSAPDDNRRARRRAHREKQAPPRDSDRPHENWNPFPPGYGDDVEGPR